MPAHATLQDLVRSLAARGAQPAVMSVAGGGVHAITYAALADQALRLAAGLARAEIAPGAPVVLFGPNSIDWIVARLALAACGAVAVAIDDLASDAELATLIPDSGAHLVFAARTHLPRLRALPFAAALDLVLLDDGAGDGDARAWRGLVATAPVTLPTIAPDDAAMLVYTSGTTGTPKSFFLSHANLLVNIDGLLADGLADASDRVLLPLPLHHVYPLTVGLFTTLASGATLVLPEAVTGPQIVAALKAARVTVMIGVPRLYAALVAGLEARIAARGKLAARVFSSLLALSIALRRRFGWRIGRRLFARVHHELAPALWLMASGGARPEPAMIWTLEGLGWEFLTGYGLAETASILTRNQRGRARIGSEGRPLPGAEIRIAAPNPQGIGEIEVRGPSLFRGYRHADDLNREIFTEDGWFRTGDLGSLDDDGFVTIAGRSKEMIVLGGGKNVFPEELETVYAASPYLREVGLLELRGALVALAVPNLEAIAASGNLRIEDVVRVALSEAAHGLPSYQRLAGFAISREPLPRTRLGKYQRFRLPELYAQASAARRPSAPRTMSEADRALLAAGPARELWQWLSERHRDRALSLDDSPQLDLGIDSLEWVTISLELERRFGVRLGEEDFAALVTLRDLVARVADAVSASAAPGSSREDLSAAQRRWLDPARPAELCLGYTLFALAWLIMRGLFRLRVEGAANLPAAAPYVVAANHVSDLDPLVLAVALGPRRLRQVHWGGDAARVFGSALGRAVARAGNVFPVDERAPATTLAFARAVLAKGEALAWFPESWRSPDGELQRFLPGIGVLLAESGAPVVPARIVGAFEAMPRGRRWPRLHPIRIVFGPPLDPRAVGGADPASITAALREAVEGLR